MHGLISPAVYFRWCIISIAYALFCFYAAASPPIPSITSPDIATGSTESFGIQNGSSLVLICSAISSVNVIFEWSDPYHQLPPHFLTSHNKSTVYTSTLTVDPFTARTAGIYTCIARNEGGEGNDTINIDLDPTSKQMEHFIYSVSSNVFSSSCKQFCVIKSRFRFNLFLDVYFMLIPTYYTHHCL